jgi:Transposase IS66 family
MSRTSGSPTQSRSVAPQRTRTSKQPRSPKTEERRAVRQAETKPLVEKLKAWLEAKLIAVSEKSTIAEAIRYGLTRWDGLARFLDDGRIEMDTNSVERTPKVILGIKFTDGIEVVRSQAQAAA